jgi:hypothetical protein
MKRIPYSILVPISAATVAGVALWVSRASFDVAGTTAAPVRVAMLPSLPELLGFVALALLASAGMASLVRTNRAFWEPATDALLPLFALSLLVIPYLPWIADWIPALRIFAGPGRILIWILVIGHVLWIFVALLAGRNAVHARLLSPSRAAVLFGIVSVALSAPFILNVRAFPATFTDAFNSIRALPSAALAAAPSGSLGVLFDQEYGIIAYAPVLLLAFVGIAGMLRSPSHRTLAIVLAAASLVLIALPASVDPWWSKSMMPGRPVFLLLPLLVVPIAWLYAQLEPNALAKAGARSLLLLSLAVTLALVVIDPRVSALQEGDGSSALLQWMSPTWDVWREAPTYVAGVTQASLLRVLLWLGAFGVGAWMLARPATVSDGRAALAATMTCAVLFVMVLTTSAAIVPDTAKPFDAEGRVMFPLLETFDPIARPIAIRYDSFSRVQPDELPPMFAMSAVPGQRTSRQPLRVVLNARFRLPAGRYVLGLKGSEAAGSIPDASMSLQLGREGRPFESWPLVLAPGQYTMRDFEVPLDAEFVGFRASRRAEQAIAELRVSPRSVVETRKRIAADTVLSAAAFAPVQIFFHESQAYPEAEGFWVAGRTTVRMTMLKVRESDPAVLLAVHSGARPNIVTLATSDWSERLELVPGVTARVAVPSKAGERSIALTISTADGFVPAEIERSRDRRLLGAWIAFIPDDIARTSATP